MNLRCEYYFEYETEARSNMKSPSLFNEYTDRKTDIQTVDLQSPTTSTADSNDGLPISDDSWSLLKDFEALAEPNKATSMYNCITTTPPIIDANLCIQETSPDDFVLPEFAQLDDLFMLANTEMTDCEPNSSLPSAANDKLPTVASTSDLLADLISHTFSMDPSLEGLLSCTTLDISTVFGESAKTEVALEIPNEDSSSATLLSYTSDSSQEVPEIKMTPYVKARKRPAPPVNKDTPVETKSKRQKLSGEEKYNEMRQKNNVASKRSRASRKQKFQSLEVQATQLEEDNKKLREKAELLEKTVKALKASLVKHILDLKSK